MMRNACGSNDHPDSTLFIQIYKLMNTYSLVKSPKGSNINNDEIFSSLVKLNDIESPADDNLLKFTANLDMVVENCSWFEDISDLSYSNDFVSDQ